MKTAANTDNLKTRQRRMFWVAFLSLTLLTACLLAGLYHWDASFEIERIETGETDHISGLASGLSQTIETVMKDVIIQTAHTELLIYLQDPAHNHQDRLAEEFRSFLTVARTYDQIRFIDSSGMEKIRVNYNAGRPEITPEEQLQNKSDRYYFNTVLRLAPGTVYISPLDLNIENGRVEEPYKPMIRFGTPVVDRFGKKQGILMLNFLAERLLNDARAAAPAAQGDITLLNARGYWLLGPKPEMEWGFMFEDRQDVTFANTKPKIWSEISKSRQGTIRRPEGSYLFTTISAPHTDAKAPGIAIESDLGVLYVVSRIPALTLDTLKYRILNKYGLVLLLAILVIGYGGLAWSRARTEQVLAARRMQEAGKAADLANRAKTGFMASISHELRSPLNPIIGLTEVLLETEEDEERVRHLKGILESSRRMLDLVNNLIEFSRLEIVTSAPECEAFSPRLALEHIVMNQGPRAGERGLTIETDLDGLPHEILHGDGRVYQAITNRLLARTINQSANGAVKITISSAPPDQGMVLVSTEIQGNGPDPALERMLLDQTDPNPDASPDIALPPDGKGLDLVLMGRLAKEMGGSVSAAPGPDHAAVRLVLPFALTAPCP